MINETTSNSPTLITRQSFNPPSSQPHTAIRNPTYGFFLVFSPFPSSLEKRCGPFTKAHPIEKHGFLCETECVDTYVFTKEFPKENIANPFCEG